MAPVTKAGFLMIALAASGCDIVGNVPDDLQPTLESIGSNCTGANRRFGVSASFDVTVAEGDEVHIRWNFSSTTTFTAGTLRPILDCGYWVGAFDFDQSSGEDFLVPDPNADYNEAVCTRVDGPPRQIVTLRGNVGLPTRASQNELIAGSIDITTCRYVDGICQTNFDSRANAGANINCRDD